MVFTPNSSAISGTDIPFARSFPIFSDVSSDQAPAVISILRTFCNEALDISGNDEQHFQAYHDARWNGVGVLEARDLLIPQLKKIRLGWNGNFGISNSGLAYNSKLAYEILKTIRYATEKRDSSVLKVTDEPLPRAEGSFQIGRD